MIIQARAQKEGAKLVWIINIVINLIHCITCILHVQALTAATVSNINTCVYVNTYESECNYSVVLWCLTTLPLCKCCFQ